jgi:hypothetical protein
VDRDALTAYAAKADRLHIAQNCTFVHRSGPNEHSFVLSIVREFHTKKRRTGVNILQTGEDLL